MALGKRLINAGAADAACSTDSVQAFGADSAFSSNIALYQLDGNDNDTTGNYDGTSDPNVTYSATGAKFGQAANFNGSSSKIVLPNSSLGITDASNFSFSCWFNTNSATQDNQAIIWTNGSNAGARFGVGINSTSQGGDTSVYFGVGTSSFTYINSGTSAFTANTWVHVVCVKSSTTGVSLYVNNVLKATNTGATGAASTTATGDNRIGGYKTASESSWFNGKIDQVRIFNKAISVEDVATLYAETTSTASDTNPLSEGSGVALYSLDYDASDAGGLYDGTPTNVDFGVGGQVNYGARFNGSSSFIDLPNLGTDLSGSNTRTLSAWVNLDANPSVYYAVVSYGAAANLQSFGIYISSTGTPRISYYNLNWDTSTTLTSGNWHHIVAVYKGGNVETSTNTELYIDGVKQTLTITNSSSLTGSANTSNSNYAIGYYKTSPSGSYFNGSIDQVRLFSKALNQTEIDTLYAETACVYDSTTDDVNYPFDNGTNVEAYYKLDNSSEDYSTGGNDGTDTNIEYRFGRFGQAAVFNGSSSRIDTNISTLTSNGGSVSLWVKTTTGAQSAFFGGQSPSTNRFYFGVRNSNFWIGAGDTQNSYNISASSLLDGNWHHVVLTLDGSTAKYYLDGNSTPVDTISYTSGGTIGVTPLIGALDLTGNVGSYTNGDIDQVRIYSTALTSSQITELYNEKPEVDTSNFKTVLYEGNGNDNRYISNLGIDLETDGGLVWTKARTAAYYHQFQDSVREAGANALYSNSTDGENGLGTAYNNTYGYINSFEANGWFTKNGSDGIGTWVNRDGVDYVGWAWKAGGEAVQNTQGDITSDVSANTEAGFSIVKYTGNGTVGATIGHGLTSAPELTIIKKLDTVGYSGGNWVVGTGVLNSNNWAGSMYLNSTAAYYTANNYFWNAAPTSIVNELKNDWFVNYNGAEYIMYNWHSVAGYSKIGSYTGNSSTQTIVTGFEPSFVMIKTINTVSNWVIFDNKRPNEYLMPSLPNAGSSSTDMVTGFVSNGFTLGADALTAAVNSSAANYLYMAFK